MKKVFIGVLAALMLFAFVACDNSGANAGAGYIAYVEPTLNSGVVYVEGEKVDPADFTFKGYDIAGTEIATIPSERFSISTTLVAGENTVDFTLDGVEVDSVKVEAKEVTGITVDSTNAETKYYAVVDYDYADPVARKTIDVSGLVVTAAYDGGEKVVKIDNDNVNSSAIEWEDVEQETTYKLTVTFAEKTGEYTVTMLPNLVKAIDVKSTEAYTVYFEGTAPATTDVPVYLADPTAADAKGIWMEKIYEGGEVVVADEDAEIKYIAQNGSELDAFTTLVPTKATSATVTMRYVGEDGTTALTGRAREDSVTVSWAEKKDVSATITGTPVSLSKDTFKSLTGYTTAANGFTVKVTANDGSSDDVNSNIFWYDGTATGMAETVNYLVLTEMDSIADYTVGDRYVFHVTGRVSGLPVEGSFEAVVK